MRKHYVIAHLGPTVYFAVNSDAVSVGSHQRVFEGSCHFAKTNFVPFVTKPIAKVVHFLQIRK